MNKSLADLQEEDEMLESEISVARKRAMLKELDRRGGRGFWRKFSDNEKLSGMNWRRALNWLRSK